MRIRVLPRCCRAAVCVIRRVGPRGRAHAAQRQADTRTARHSQARHDTARCHMWVTRATGQPKMVADISVHVSISLCRNARSCVCPRMSEDRHFVRACPLKRPHTHTTHRRHATAQHATTYIQHTSTQTAHQHRPGHRSTLPPFVSYSDSFQKRLG